jgi:hypothetical protein
MRSSGAIRIHRARRKKPYVRTSTCERIKLFFFLPVSLCQWLIARILNIIVGSRDLKTVTIWFQNKRQTVARSNRKQLESEGPGTITAAAATPTAAMDMLASASATMFPLAATVSPASAVQRDSGAGGPCSVLDPSASQLLPGTSTPSVSTPKSQLLAAPSRVPLSVAVAHDPNYLLSPTPSPDMSTSAEWISSPSLELRHKPRLGHNGPIHPEDLWKYIPSSPAQPALSSPDVSPKIGAPSGDAKHSLQRPPTLEWACARSAKRRRTKPDAVQFEDEETDSEWGDAVDHIGTCHSSFRVSEARVPLECYDKYPLDVVRGAILLLGLRDLRGPGV